VATLLVKERHGLPIVSRTFLRRGFPDEGPKQFGLTALMTKCLLKGSGGMDNAHYNEALDALAARVDTVTEKDYWGLTLDVLAPRFDDALALMAHRSRGLLLKPRKWPKNGTCRSRPSRGCLTTPPNTAC